MSKIIALKIRTKCPPHALLWQLQNPLKSSIPPFHRTRTLAQLTLFGKWCFHSRARQSISPSQDTTPSKDFKQYLQRSRRPSNVA